MIYLHDHSSYSTCVETLGPVGAALCHSTMLRSYFKQIYPTPAAPLPVCCFKLGEMICCFLLDETGWHGILNSPAQIERNKHRGALVTATDNRQDVETTPEQTRQCLQISIFRYVRSVCVWERARGRQDSRSAGCHIDGDWVQLTLESISSRGLIYLSIRSLLLYCPSPSWFVCQPRWLRCCPIMNRDTALCGLIIK